MTPSKYQTCITCIALVKPGSALAKGWDFGRPVYGIYEGAPASGFDELLSFGDGSWQRITDENRNDIVLVPQLGEDFVEDLFS